MTICERVFSLLASDGRDQKDLAAHIGVSTRTLSTWKTRGTNPGAEYIAGIAEFFSVSTDYILTGEERQYSVSPADEEVLSAYTRSRGRSRSIFWVRCTAGPGWFLRSPPAMRAKSCRARGFHRVAG